MGWNSFSNYPPHLHYAINTTSKNIKKRGRNSLSLFVLIFFSLSYVEKISMTQLGSDQSVAVFSKRCGSIIFSEIKTQISQIPVSSYNLLLYIFIFSHFSLLIIKELIVHIVLVLVS